MKILYDHQIFTSQKYGGISRYFYELIREFDTIEDIETNIPLIVSNNHYISEQKYVKYLDFLPNKNFRGKQRLFNLFNKPNSILKLKQQNFDVFHPTYYDPYFLNYIGSKPFVLTVYDMIHEKFNEMFPVNDKTSQKKRLLVEKASKIIAISENTKKDLIEIFGTDESKIEVIYLGNSMFPKIDTNLSIKIPKKYILFVGSRGGYKNFERFINSIALLLNENSDLSVVCAGGGKFNNKEYTLFKKLNVESRVFQYSLDDNLLAQFYSKALIFVFPSLYEGFGIPILESFACKCPLLCSNTSSLPEIAGNGAKYFDPYSDKSMYDAIKKILDSDEQKNSLIKNGTERLKFFSWEQAAKQTKKIYGSVME